MYEENFVNFVVGFVKITDKMQARNLCPFLWKKIMWKNMEFRIGLKKQKLFEQAKQLVGHLKLLPGSVCDPWVIGSPSLH